MQKMEKRRKLNKVKVGITIFLIVLLMSITVFGRYFYNGIKEAYFRSKQFYFTSNLLTLGGQTYTYENWGGLDTYELNVALYSYENKLMKLDYDLQYTISCEAVQSDKIKCTIGTEDGPTSQNGVIYATTNVSNVAIFVKPLVQINKGETVKIRIKARTEVPYIKEISCEVTLRIAKLVGNSYEIEDAENNEYAILKLKNISESATETTLVFDPTKLRLDLNDEIYKNKISSDTATINGNKYIKKITFKVEAESIKFVKFYKVDKSQNYKYPNGAASSAIEVNI